MDQDTSNSPGKARWRERLGMGNSGKEMPKISDEFKPASAPPRPAPPRENRLPPATIQGHQPVTRPAPMAPRTPAQASGSRPIAPVPQGGVGLGDRLRAERQAAERLAEQRVAQARGRSAERPAPPLSPPQSQKPQNQKPAAPERPKFTFSPEELAKDKRETAPPSEREFPSFSGKSSTGATPPPPLTPPRPALGGNAGAQQQPQRQQPPRPQAGNPKPPAGNAKLPAGNAKPPGGSPKPLAGSPPPSAGSAFQPRYNGPPQPTPPGGNYRSLDPPPGSLAPRPRPYADTAAAFREEPSARRDDPLARRQPANREYDSYRRGPALPPQQQAYGEESEGPSFTDYRRRPPVPARARQPAYDEDVNEVFEDEEPPRPQRRRASAQDYNRAYRDYEDGYDGETPRRRGPWPWLLAILLGGIILTGGIIYYYLTYYKQAGPASGNVPVIEAPEQGAKSAPEPSSGSTLGTQGSAQPSADDKRKQIYDRILGDDEVNGNQVVPTQEQPQIVEPTGNNEGQDAAPVPDPASGAKDNNSSEPLPLPLPPPGGTDPQGSLQTNSNQQTAGLGAVNESTASQPEPTSTNTADNGAPVPGQLAKATEQISSSPPPDAEQAVTDPDPLPAEPVKPAKPKLKTAEKKVVQKVAAVEDDQQTGGVEPLVLVPPAQPGINQTQIAEPDAVPQSAESAAPEQKSKSFFNFGSNGKRKLTGKAAESAQARGTGTSGNWVNSPDPSKVSADSSGSEPQQQIASISPQPEAQPLPAPEPQQPVEQAKPSSGSGFVAQLASFRSEAEAMAEFDRLRAKHGNVLSGLSPRVVKATVAGASRYRLGVGPLASRAAASKICNSLIAAGERDCLVRGN